MDKNTRKLVIIIIILLAAALGVFCFVYLGDNSNNNLVGNSYSNLNSGTTTEVDTITPIEESAAINVEYTSQEEDGNYTNYTAKIDVGSLKVDGSGVAISGTQIKVTSAGTYYFTGTNNDCNIVVEADKNAEVILVFDNCNITSTKTAVINGVTAKTIVVNLSEDSKNIFTDASDYKELNEDNEPDATIFSKTDLVINGSGKLFINANYKDGIASKDTLKIVNTNIEISSKDDGIRGKDFVAIKNSNITINAEGDGIKSTNEDEGLGYVLIDGGKIDIESENDAIQAQNVLNISNADITIKTTGDTSSKNSDGETGSSKGLKSGKEITINSGTITINSTDDSIHSNKYLIINGGTISINSGDDGIHADNNILINEGKIVISKSYEGIESSYIKINGGEIAVVATDDGINIGGGNDGSGFGRPGANTFSSQNGGRELVINGGKIVVKSNGDGLDSNGSISITGGDITVAGATNGGNGALDYDQSCVVTGGSLIVYGANGMWQNPSNTSTQYSIAFASTGKSGDTIELKDSSGNVIASTKTLMNYGMICISNSKLQKGETYILYVNGEEKASQELTSIVTTNGSTQGGMMNGGGRIMR